MQEELGRVLAACYLTRVSTATQFASQVLPPSSENAHSLRQEVALMSDQMSRTRMVLPWYSSWYMNSPRPSLNPPRMASPSAPLLLLARYTFHCCDAGS